MSIATITPPRPTKHHGRPSPATAGCSGPQPGRVDQDARSVRSTVWTLLVAIGLAVGFGALVGVARGTAGTTSIPSNAQVRTRRRSASAACSSRRSPSVCSASS